MANNKLANDVVIFINALIDIAQNKYTYVVQNEYEEVIKNIPQKSVLIEGKINIEKIVVVRRNNLAKNLY